MASIGGSETRVPFAVDDALLYFAVGGLWAVRLRPTLARVDRSVLTRAAALRSM